MSGDDDFDLPGYVFRSTYGLDHLSINAQRTLCGKVIPGAWNQRPRKYLCNKCLRVEERLLAAIEEES